MLPPFGPKARCRISLDGPHGIPGTPPAEATAGLGMRDDRNVTGGLAAKASINDAAGLDWRAGRGAATIAVIGDHGLVRMGVNRRHCRLEDLGGGGYRMAAALLRAGLPAAGLLAASLSLAPAKVLDENDLSRIARIKPSFVQVMTDVSQSAQRQDLSQADGECIRSTLQGLMQISEELRTYENLITIEGELTDFGDDRTLRGILRFAVDNALKVLENERKRMGDLSEQCSRHPLSAGKTRQAIQFIEGTTAILRSLQPRL
jgi:hypothetical protein